MFKKDLTIWIEGTIVAALAIVLSLIPTNIGPSFTISLGMIPLTLYSIRRGWIPGVYSGFLWGILHFLIGNASILTFWQGFIEYFVAFAFAGFAGFVTPKIVQMKSENKNKSIIALIIVASLVGTVARFFWHFLAGVIFWGSFAPEGVSPVMYSLVMNGVSAFATLLATTVVLSLIYKTSPRIYFAP